MSKVSARHSIVCSAVKTRGRLPAHLSSELRSVLPGRAPKYERMRMLAGVPIPHGSRELLSNIGMQGARSCDVTYLGKTDAVSGLRRLFELSFIGGETEKSCAGKEDTRCLKSRARCRHVRISESLPLLLS